MKPYLSRTYIFLCDTRLFLMLNPDFVDKKLNFDLVCETQSDFFARFRAPIGNIARNYRLGPKKIGSIPRITKLKNSGWPNPKLVFGRTLTKWHCTRFAGHLVLDFLLHATKNRAKPQTAWFIIMYAFNDAARHLTKCSKRLLVSICLLCAVAPILFRLVTKQT